LVDDNDIIRNNFRGVALHPQQLWGWQNPFFML
jgi:hypothetical protein